MGQFGAHLTRLPAISGVRPGELQAERPEKGRRVGGFDMRDSERDTAAKTTSGSPSFARSHGVGPGIGTRYKRWNHGACIIVGILASGTILCSGQSVTAGLASEVYVD